MRSLLSLLQFTTILPLGRAADLEDFARHSYLFPLAGYVIGGLAALPGLFITDSHIAAGCAVCLVILLSGAHHFDGLLDLGDGLMAHGEREVRIRALTDRYIGAGGITAGILVTLLLYSGLTASLSVPVTIIVGEISAKVSMSVLTTYGRPFKEGIHNYIHGFSRPWFPLLSLLSFIPLIVFPLTYLQLLGAVLVSVIIPLLLKDLSDRVFGGVNGDIVGASNEITRASAVLIIAILG